jgi:tellurite resistance protein
MAAVDRELSDNELRRIGSMVQHLPIFRDFDPEQLVVVAEECGALLEPDDGLEQVLTQVAAALPERLRETAYAVAVEVAAVDLAVGQEELRLLQILRDRLDLDKLVSAAIERGARARHQTL